MNTRSIKLPASECHWRNRCALVTGATGLVGYNLVCRLLELQAEVVCFVRDDDPASALWFSGDIERVRVVSGRLQNFEDVKAAIVEREVDCVFHLGAQALIGAAQRDPLGTFESNTRGTWNILEACRLYGDRVRSIVIASSDKAYGECPGAYVESMPLQARNPYDVSKSCADIIAQSYAHTYQLPIAIARCGNIFGPGDLNWSRLVPGSIRSLLAGERPILRSNGSPVRDYLYVEDAVSGYLSLARWAERNPKADDQCAFNFSAQQPLTVIQMLSLIQNVCNRADLPPIIENAASGEIAQQRLDCTKAHELLGWCATVDLDKALRHTVDWYAHYLRRRCAHSSSLHLSASPLARASA